MPADAINGSVNSGWRQRLNEAGVVLDHASDLAAEVVAGRVALDKAYREAEENRKTAERLAAVGPDLAALIESGVIDLDEAERRADVVKRLKDLPPNLAQKVRDGEMTVGDADAKVATEVDVGERVVFRLRHRDAAPGARRETEFFGKASNDGRLVPGHLKSWVFD